MARGVIWSLVLGFLVRSAVAAGPPARLAEQRGASQESAGFDSNDYPGDQALPALRKHFAFAGYWLNAPPGERSNGWVGKRETLRNAGFGFLVLWNGRLEAEIRKAPDSGPLGLPLGGRLNATAKQLGERDGAAAVAAAKRERFPGGAIVFLDQEEGGRLLPEQAAYLLAWTEAVAHGGYRPGVYGSGQPVSDGPGVTITTAEDIRARVKAGGLHEVAMWVYQDGCPPSNGCSLAPPPLAKSGTAGAEVWQYAQSPRRPEITKACAKTYAADGNCYVPELPGMQMDLSVAGSADPSRGR